MNHSPHLKTIFIIFSMQLFVRLSAQEILISPAIDVGRAQSYELVSTYDTITYLYRKGRSDHYLHAFDSRLNELWKRKIDYPRNQVHLLDIIVGKTDFQLIYAFHKRGKTEIHGQHYNEEAQLTESFEIAVLNAFIPYSSLETTLSDNKKQLLVYAIKPQNNLDAVCYDLGNKEQHWLRESSFNNVNFFRDFSQLLINNQAEVFVVLERNNQKRKLHKHHFEIHKVDVDGNIDVLRYDFRKHLSYDYQFCYDEKNRQLLAAGLYSSQPNYAEGLFYLKIVSVDSMMFHASPFEVQLMRSVTGDKRKRIKGIANLDIQELILRRDGGIICIAEQNKKYDYQLSNTYQTDPLRSQQTDFHYENILVCSIHPDGAVHWQEVLYKSQHSENDDARYSSFFLMKTPENIRFLYNDDINWTSNLFEYVLNGLGSVQRQRIFLEQEVAIMPEFRKARQIAASSCIATSYRGNKLHLVSISYPEPSEKNGRLD